MAKGVKVSEEDKQLSAVLKAAFAMERPRRTITEIAPKIGLSYDILSNILNGRTKADTTVIELLRKELKKPKGWPFTELAAAAGSAATADREGHIVSIAGTPLVKLPVIGKVEAGSGFANVDTELREIWVPETLARSGDYGWEVEGESMMPDLVPGDVLVFREMRRPRKGHAMLLRSADREDRVKIVEWKDNEWVLVSLNPAFPPEPLGDHELIGLFTGFYRYKGTREVILSDPEGLDLPLF